MDFAEFRHNRIVQSPYENYFDVGNIKMRFHEDDYLFPEGKTPWYLKTPQSNAGCKKINSGCWIHAPTSRNYFY